MKVTKKTVFFSILTVLLCACGSQKEIAYMQNSEILNNDLQKPFLYDAHILPKDLLTITVNCSNPELVVPFNLAVNSSSQSQATLSGSGLQTYLVDNNGNIDFPILGTLHLGGLTKSKTEAVIKERLETYLKEVPIVNVRMVNYKFSVLGEVANPNTFTIATEKVNIFEALAMAGDLTIYGKRDNVKLLREDEQGRKKIILLNLKDPAIITSPYYYLQQNDIVYVEPNKAKASGANVGTGTTLLISATSLLVSLTSLIVNLIK